jgi:hypothetical protein
MTRLGANCPASVPSLLLGCVEAYSLAISHGHTNTRSIANVAKQGVTGLAKLSPRERSRVQNKLLSLNVMLDVQLKLAMMEEPDDNSTSAACLLIQHLSDIRGLASLTRSGTSPTKRNNDNDITKESRKSEQSSGDRAREMEDMPVSESQEPTLPQLLYDNAGLYKQTLGFFADEFSRLAASSNILEGTPKGRLCLLLKAYSWLLLVPSKKLPKFEASLYLLEKVLPKLRSLMEGLLEGIIVPQETKVPDESAFDQILKLMQCSVLLTLTRVLRHANNGDDSDEAKQARQACEATFDLFREFPSVSRCSDGFRFNVQCAIHNAHPFVLYTHIIHALTTSGKTQDVQISRDSFIVMETGLCNLCLLLKKEATPVVDICGDDKLDLLSRLSNLLLQINEDPEQQADDSYTSKTKETLQSILTDAENQVKVASIIHNDTIARFVADATKFLCGRPGLQVPLVQSSQLELLASNISIGGQNGRKAAPNETAFKFLLQLLHAFEYLDQEPRSPFAFDPRSLPIKEALNTSKALSTGAKRHFLESRLDELACKHCPDILSLRTEILSDDVAFTLFDSMSRRDIMDSLYATLRSHVQGCMADQEAQSIEGIFLQAKSRLSHADLCSTVLSSFLASPHKPPPSFTYSLLCRDPLIIFKCPMKVWKCKGLRRIALTVMCSMLESNSTIVSSAPPMEGSADELIAARNAMVVRCLLMCICGIESEISASYCAMTTSVIRYLISGHRGLVALLVKQGLHEMALDWLVEYVPECMNDSQDLLQMLSERSSLTPAERLVAADAVIRIAIVHGHTNEIEAANMAYTALVQLVDSFFLVVGPVGVPVNALISDDSGLDVTQISRKAAFRILKSLLRVRGRRTLLRTECGMALQKVASLCKGESSISGVAGAVAGRRKTLLKEIFDAVMKAANAMGSSVGSLRLD